MNKLFFYLVGFCGMSIALSSCGGGGEEKAPTYSLSTTDFMQRQKCILIAGTNYAWAIVPQEANLSGELVGPNVTCDAWVFPYKTAQDPEPLAEPYRIRSLSYAVDGSGIGYLTFKGVETDTVDNVWHHFCNTIAGDAELFNWSSYDKYAGGAFAVLSDVKIVLNFSGSDKGRWASECKAITVTTTDSRMGQGLLYLRYWEKLGL